MNNIRPVAPGLLQPDGWHYASAVDTETSGVCGRSRVVQIAALRFRFRDDVIEFSDKFRLIAIVRPPIGTPFSPFAVAVTGIGPKEAEKGTPFRALLPRFREILAGFPVVAHNAPFDRRMVAREYEASGETQVEASRWLCSMSACRGRVGSSSLKLGDVARFLGIKASGALHDAGTDAELAARIYARITLAEKENSTLRR